MGWLRLVGSLNVQVSFAEYSLFHRAFLQKRPITLRSLRIVANPHTKRPMSDKERGNCRPACVCVYVYVYVCVCVCVCVYVYRRRRR